jgi:hypothetical protein
MKVEYDVIEDVIYSVAAPVTTKRLTTPTTARIPHPPIPFSMFISIPNEEIYVHLHPE